MSVESNKEELIRLNVHLFTKKASLAREIDLLERKRGRLKLEAKELSDLNAQLMRDNFKGHQSLGQLEEVINKCEVDLDLAKQVETLEARLQDANETTKSLTDSTKQASSASQQER